MTRRTSTPPPVGTDPRRQVLKALGLGLIALQTPAVWAQAATEDKAAGASPAADLGPQDLRWLNRITYGATPTDAQRLAQLGRAAFLDEQLAPPEAGSARALASRFGPDATTLEQSLQQRAAIRKAEQALRKKSASAPDTPPTPEEKQVKDEREASNRNQQRLLADARQAIFTQAVTSPRQIEQQMLWFWLNHFSVFAPKDDVASMVGDYASTLQPLVLGPFADLLRASLMHPAMQVYLDNDNNRAGKINENYARELMELHTLGVNQGYTQRDVQEMARVLTGLQINTAGEMPRLTGKMAKEHGREVFAQGALVFNPARHDYGEKTLLGLTVPGTGWNEIETLIGVLARHPSTAQHLSRQLYQYFVNDNPASAPQALIDSMSLTYLKSQGHIGQTLKMLLQSDAFEGSLGQKFKSPYQYSVSLVRALPLDRDPASSEASDWLGSAARLPADLGEALFNYRTPDGYSMNTRDWINPAHMVRRVRTAQAWARRWDGLRRKAGAAPADSSFLPWTWQSALLSPRTLQALGAQNQRPEAVALFLSSPEFMLR